MRVFVSVSGGFVGLRRTTVLDTDTLAPEHVADLEQAVAAFAESAGRPRRGSEPVYDVEVSDAGTTRRFSFPESAVPPTLRGLLATSPPRPDDASPA